MSIFKMLGTAAIVAVVGLSAVACGGGDKKEAAGSEAAVTTEETAPAVDENGAETPDNDSEQATEENTQQ